MIQKYDINELLTNLNLLLPTVLEGNIRQDEVFRVVLYSFKSN